MVLFSVPLMALALGHLLGQGGVASGHEGGVRYTQEIH